MPYKKKVYKAKRRLFKKVARKPRVSRIPRAPFNAMVRRAMQQTAEKKMYQTSAINQTVTSELTITDINSIPFQPSQGTGQANRVGNQVKLLKVEIRGHINAIQNTQGGSNQYLTLNRVFVGRCKEGLSVNATQVDALMQSGNIATRMGPSVQSFYRPFNKDMWNIYRTKVCKIAPASMSATSFNNDYKNMCQFKFVMHPNMIVKFSDTTAAPQNYNIFIAAVGIDTQGSGAVFSNQNEFHYEAIFTYTDV